MSQDPLIHRMPYGFGPSPGPRQGPDGEPFDWTEAPRSRTILVGFETDPHALDCLLPPGFKRAGDPIVVVNVTYLTELPWLAGRGYSLLGVRFPAMYQGKSKAREGVFLSVLWENMADPIITGREELGYSKLYADIHEPTLLGDREYHGASWGGHRFLDVELSALEDGGPPQVLTDAARFGEGVLHYKYVPATGRPGKEDLSYACLSPHGNSAEKVDRMIAGQGRVTFHPTRWDQMPTQFHIVNKLAELPVLQWTGAAVIESHGGKDLSDQSRME